MSVGKDMIKKNDFNPIVRKLTRREQLQQDVSQSSSFINGIKDASHTPERLAAYIDQLPKEKVLLFLKLSKSALNTTSIKESVLQSRKKVKLLDKHFDLLKSISLKKNSSKKHLQKQLQDIAKVKSGKLLRLCIDAYPY